MSNPSYSSPVITSLALATFLILILRSRTMASRAGKTSTNGSNGNGVHDSDSSGSTKMETPAMSSAASLREKPAPVPKPTREGVSANFSQFGQLIHASKGPIPAQNGFGTFSTVNQRPGFKKDLKALRMKGMVSLTLYATVDLTPE